jgi:hypothetical protein
MLSPMYCVDRPFLPIAMMFFAGPLLFWGVIGALLIILGNRLPAANFKLIVQSSSRRHLSACYLIEGTEGRKRTIIAKRTVLEKCHSENPPR